MIAFPFRLKHHCLAINAPAERFQMINRIMCHELETLFKFFVFFQLLERYRSWHSVLISIYWLDAHNLKKRKCDKAIKRCMRSSMNSAVVCDTHTRPGALNYTS